MKSVRHNYNRLVKSFLWSVLAALVIYGVSVIASDLRAVTTSAAKLGVSGWLIILGLSLVNYGLRFVRWQAYLKWYGYMVPTGTSLVYYLAGFGFTTTPGKAGEAVRSFYLKRHGVSYVDSLAAFFVERFVDVIAMLLLAITGVLSFPDFRWIVLVATGLILGLLPLIHSKSLNGILNRYLLRVSSSRLRAAGAHLLDLLQSASTLLKSGPLYAGLLLGILSWGAEGVAFHAILSILDVQTTLWLSVGIYSLSVLIGALSFIPGGLGSTEAVMVFLLTLTGAATTTALAATLICRLATLWFAVVIGWVAVSGLKIQETHKKTRQDTQAGI